MPKVIKDDIHTSPAPSHSLEDVLLQLQTQAKSQDLSAQTLLTASQSYALAIVTAPTRRSGETSRQGP